MIDKTLIEEDYKSALRNKEELKVATLRLLKTSLHNLEIEKQSPLSSEEIWQTVEKEIKKRREAVEQYKRGKREDLAKKEENEIEILSAYLPKQATESEIEKLVREAILKTGAQSLANLGKVMKEVMPKLKGRAEGAKIIEIVKRELRGS